jgi:hypothetical protein
MKKNNTRPQSPKPGRKLQGITIGMDLGRSHQPLLHAGRNREVLREGSVATTRKGMTQVFAQLGRCRMAMRGRGRASVALGQR